MEKHPGEKLSGGLPLLFSLFLGLTLLAHAVVMAVFGGGWYGLTDWAYLRGDLSRSPAYADAVANLYRTVAITAAGAGDAVGKPTETVSDDLELQQQDENGIRKNIVAASSEAALAEDSGAENFEEQQESAFWPAAEETGDSAAQARAAMRDWLSHILSADGQNGGQRLGIAVQGADGSLQKDYPVTVPFDEETGQPVVPAGWRLEVYWDGESLTAANEKILEAYQNTAWAIRPLEQNMAGLRIALITRSWDAGDGIYTSWYFGNDALYYASYTASNEHAASLLVLGELAVGLPMVLLPLVLRRRRRAGAAAFARFTGWFLAEFKLLCAALDLAVVYWLARAALYEVGGSLVNLATLSAIGGFLLVVPFCVLLTDLLYNGAAVFHNNLWNLTRRAVHALTSRSGLEKSLMTRAWAAAAPAILGCAGFCMIPLAGLSGWYGGGEMLLGLVLCLLLIALGGILLLWLCGRAFRTMGAYARQVGDLAEGRPAQPLPLKPGDTFAAAERDLMNLQEGVRRAVDQAVAVQLQAERVQLQSERMKVELIANVSHDLKTPLTSVVNYADLLCEEPLQAPADHYAQVLRGKAYRLKTMVQDVFDVSKAASGALPLQPELIDLSRLIGQTLADMDEKIAASGLEFKVNLAAEVLVFADGAKLYRVFQNLLDNALKYAMPASRVYVDVARQEGQAAVRVRNVSARALDIPPEELVERFVRGDASRTDGGSGLGLSIAKTFTEACGGAFELRFDADLVTAAVRLPLAPEDGEKKKKDRPGPEAAAREEAACPAADPEDCPGPAEQDCPGPAAQEGDNAKAPPPKCGDGAAETSGQPSAPDAAQAEGAQP